MAMSSEERKALIQKHREKTALAKELTAGKKELPPKEVPAAVSPLVEAGGGPVFFDDIAISKKVFGLNPRKFTNRKALEFFNEYIKHGILTKACRIVGINPRTVYDAVKLHPKFADAMAVARRIAIERLEEEAHRRAVEGVAEPVFYQGEEVGTVQRYSDRLLELLLEANKPTKFGREKRSGGTPSGGEGGGGPAVQVIIQQFGDGKTLAVIQNNQAKENDGTAKDSSPVQVETPDLSDPGMELP